ncbi:MAG: hypothetical protein AAF587_23985 [Bacteroidota bacterium]
MKLHLSLLLAGIAGLFTACGPTAPTEAEVRSRIIGTYCEGWKYRLELTDSTYVNRSVEQGAFRNSVNLRCNGAFSLRMENDQWVISFEKAEWPHGAIVSCEQEYVLWNKEEGYTGGENSITMRAPLDGKILVKGPCDE